MHNKTRTTHRTPQAMGGTINNESTTTEPPPRSELPGPILQKFVESDHGCTSRNYFDNAGDNVMLILNLDQWFRRRHFTVFFF